MESTLPEEDQNNDRPNVIRIESIYIDLDGPMESQQEERDCQHFSIRGYTAEMRTKDIRRCNIFESDDNQSNANEETPILPPLTVGSKFKSWKCSNCLRVSAADEAAAAAGSLSTPTGSDLPPPPPSNGLVILQPDSDPTPPMLHNLENAIVLSDNLDSGPSPPVLDNLENAILLSDNSDSDPTPPVPDNLDNVILLSDDLDSDPTPPVPDNLENAILLLDSEPTPPVLENTTIAGHENATGNDTNEEIGDMISDETETNSKGSVPDPENGSGNEKYGEIIVHPSCQELAQKSHSEEADQSNENQEIGHPECDEMDAHPSSPSQQPRSEAGLDIAAWKGKAVVEFGEPSSRSGGATQNRECETPKVADTTDEARANVVESHTNETPILAEKTQRDDDDVDEEEDDVNFPRNPRKMRLLNELSAPNRGRSVAVRGNHKPRWSGDRRGKRKMDQGTCSPRKQSTRAKTFMGDAEISDSGPINSGAAVRRGRPPRLHLGKPTQLLESNQIEIGTNAERECVDQNEKLPDHTLPAVCDAQNLVLLGNGGISHQQDFSCSKKSKNKNTTLEAEEDDDIPMDIVEMIATKMYTCKPTIYDNDAQLCPPSFKRKEIDLKTYARGTTVSQLARLLDTSIPTSSNVVKLFSPSNHEPKEDFDRSIQEQSKVNFRCIRPPPSLFAQTSKRPEKLPPVRPRERKSRKLDIRICSLNRNPAEFTVPASTNEFMISGADLKLIN